MPLSAIIEVPCSKSLHTRCCVCLTRQKWPEFQPLNGNFRLPTAIRPTGTFSQLLCTITQELHTLISPAPSPAPYSSLPDSGAASAFGSAPVRNSLSHSWRSAFMLRWAWWMIPISRAILACDVAGCDHLVPFLKWVHQRPARGD